MPTTAERTIGERIALARDHLDLTQAELAAEVGGMDRTAVAKIESGRRKVSASELVKLAVALDRPIDWFVTESPPAVVSRRSDPASGGVSQLLDRKIERLARDVEFLERDNVLPSVPEQRLQLPDTFEGAEGAAAEARHWMGAGDGPLIDLQRHSEIVGLLAVTG
jgi:transcriptional regulator with XRE-family HTH domain